MFCLTDSWWLISESIARNLKTCLTRSRFMAFYTMLVVYSQHYTQLGSVLCHEHGCVTLILFFTWCIQLYVSCFFRQIISVLFIFLDHSPLPHKAAARRLRPLRPPAPRLRNSRERRTRVHRLWETPLEPLRCLEDTREAHTWLGAAQRPVQTYHFIAGSGTGEDGADSWERRRGAGDRS